MNQRRSSSRMDLFSVADARGNNPHGTREDADHEGKRLNAKRYETVGQLDRALDVRARTPVNAVAPVSSSGGFDLGSLLLLGVVAAVAYAFVKKDESVVDEDDDDVAASPLASSPQLQAPQLALPPPATVTVVQAPVPPPALVQNPVIDVEAKPVRRRRRRKKVEPVTVVVNASTPTSTPPTSPTSPTDPPKA